MLDLIATLLIVLPHLETPHGVKDNVKENAIGRYQIRPVFVADVNRILGLEYFTHEDAREDGMARRMVRTYLRHYGRAYEINHGEEPSLEDLARMFNGGPKGYEKESTVEYGERAVAIAQEMKNDG